MIWDAMDRKRIRCRIWISIEHGHTNNRSDDFSSVVYWYQNEPHKSFPEMTDEQSGLLNI